jgi:hypothetical protein
VGVEIIDFVLGGIRKSIQIIIVSTQTHPRTSPMRNLTFTLCLTIVVLLGSVGSSFALPQCPGTYNKTTWTNCFGAMTGYYGYYVGEFRDGFSHGQGTFTFPDGRVKEGIFKKSEFEYSKTPSDAWRGSKQQ